MANPSSSAIGIWMWLGFFMLALASTLWTLWALWADWTAAGGWLSHWLSGQ